MSLPVPILDLTKASREEWLAARGLGGSDAAAICGVNPYRTAFEVWLEKTGQKAPFEGNSRTRWGQRLEDVIAAAFAEETGYEVFNSNAMYAHPKHHCLTATIDRWAVVAGELIPLQIKNTGSHFAAAWEDGLPDPVHVQTLHEAEVVQAPYAFACALIGGNSLKWHRVDRDSSADVIVRVELEFWERVQSMTPPLLSAGDTDALRVLYPKSSDLEVLLTPEIEERVWRYQEAAERAKAADEEKRKYQAEVMAFLGDAGIGAGKKYKVSWKSQKRSAYTVAASESRVFRVSETKEKNDNGKK